MRLLWFAMAWGSIVFAGRSYLNDAPSEELKSVRLLYRRMVSMINNDDINYAIKKRQVRIQGSAILQRLAILEEYTGSESFIAKNIHNLTFVTKRHMRKLGVESIPLSNTNAME